MGLQSYRAGIAVALFETTTELSPDPFRSERSPAMLFLAPFCSARRVGADRHSESMVA